MHALDLHAPTTHPITRKRAQGFCCLILSWLCALAAGCASAPPATTTTSQPPEALIHAHTPPHDPAARCEGGDGAACLEVAAQALTRGDATAAANASQRACQTGLARGCVALGEAYVRGDVASRGRDLGYAARLFEQGCRGGDPRGCALGYGLDALACEAQVHTSCVRAGAALLLGRGVARDRARGQALMQRACEAGEPHGCYNLAVVLRRRDPEQAAALRQRACAGGIKDACAPTSATAANRTTCTACAAAR